VEKQTKTMAANTKGRGERKRTRMMAKRYDSTHNKQYYSSAKASITITIVIKGHMTQSVMQQFFVRSQV
jgi:hypothetical protein